jgi:hypothetical protein
MNTTRTGQEDPFDQNQRSEDKDSIDTNIMLSSIVFVGVEGGHPKQLTSDDFTVLSPKFSVSPQYKTSGDMNIKNFLLIVSLPYKDARTSFFNSLNAIVVHWGWCFDGVN